MARGVRRLGGAVLAAAAICASATAGVTQAATVRLGPPTLTKTTSFTFCATPDCSYVFDALAAPSSVLTAPSDGTITAWRMLGMQGGTGSLTLLVAHPDGGLWTATQRSAATAVDGSPMTTSLPIQAGDRIGVTIAGNGLSNAVNVVSAASGSRLLFQPPLGSTPVSPNQTATGFEMQFNADVTLTPPTIASLTPSAGPLRGGPAVTIAGAHLANAGPVSFGGNPATIVSNTNTALVVRPPDHLAGPVDVSVTTPGGSTTARYRYFETPVVTDLTPNSGPTAGGTRVTIRGSGFDGANRVAFGDAVARVISVAPTRIEAVSPAHPAGAVDVTVSNPGATSSTSVADGFTYGDAAPGPGPSPGPSPTPANPFTLTGLAMTPRTLHRRTVAQITYRLDRAARVRFTVRRRVRGHLRKVRAFTDQGAAGENARTFTARRLASGRYRLTARATDGSGAKSNRARLRFRVRR